MTTSPAIAGVCGAAGAGGYLKRLAFWTIRAEEAAGASELFHLTGSKAEDIDVVMTVDEVDVETQQQALDCYVTYRETIERRGPGAISRARRCLRSIRRRTIRRWRACLRDSRNEVVSLNCLDGFHPVAGTGAPHQAVGQENELVLDRTVVR